MRLSTVAACLSAGLVAGCMTAEEVRASDEAKCRSYGFRKNTTAFAECQQQLEEARMARLRDASLLVPVIPAVPRL